MANLSAESFFSKSLKRNDFLSFKGERPISGKRIFRAHLSVKCHPLLDWEKSVRIPHCSKCKILTQKSRGNGKMPLYRSAMYDQVGKILWRGRVQKETSAGPRPIHQFPFGAKGETKRLQLGVYLRFTSQINPRKCSFPTIFPLWEAVKQWSKSIPQSKVTSILPLTQKTSSPYNNSVSTMFPGIKKLSLLWRAVPSS